MKVLMVSAHPSKESFNSMLAECVSADIAAAGHELRHFDLYADGFDPVFGAFERENHVSEVKVKLDEIPELRPYVDALQWCDSLLFMYPTWWSGQPAIVKGWIDRVLMYGVAWDLPEGEARLRPLLTNVRRLIVVTTHGSPKYVNALQGESGKRTIFRAVRLMCHRRTRCRWIAVYGLDTASEKSRAAMVTRVRRRLARAL